MLCLRNCVWSYSPDCGPYRADAESLLSQTDFTPSTIQGDYTSMLEMFVAWANIVTVVNAFDVCLIFVDECCMIDLMPYARLIFAGSSMLTGCSIDICCSFGTHRMSTTIPICLPVLLHAPNIRLSSSSLPHSHSSSWDLVPAWGLVHRVQFALRT